MKKLIYFYLIFSFFAVCCSEKKKFDLTNVPKEDIYKENQINYTRKYQAGKKEGNRVLNDQIELDVYVSDFNIQKGNKVCDFYNEYFKTLANELDGHLTIDINVWSEKVSKDKLEDPGYQDKYYKGGLMRNYFNDVKEQNVYN